jgi:hypothetical protein
MWKSKKKMGKLYKECREIEPNPSMGRATHEGDKVSHHPKMAENSLLGAHVFIYSFHLLGNQFSKIMFIHLRSTHNP